MHTSKVLASPLSFANAEHMFQYKSDILVLGFHPAKPARRIPGKLSHDDPIVQLNLQSASTSQFSMGIHSVHNEGPKGVLSVQRVFAVRVHWVSTVRGNHRVFRMRVHRVSTLSLHLSLAVPDLGHPAKPAVVWTLLFDRQIPIPIAQKDLRGKPGKEYAWQCRGVVTCIATSAYPPLTRQASSQAAGPPTACTPEIRKKERLRLPSPTACIKERRSTGLAADTIQHHSHMSTQQKPANHGPAAVSIQHLGLGCAGVTADPRKHQRAPVSVPLGCAQAPGPA
eukprot:1157424-Pelagomonas_calceolata.AAC.8